jgi:hypothetical protein
LGTLVCLTFAAACGGSSASGGTTGNNSSATNGSSNGSGSSGANGNGTNATGDAGGDNDDSTGSGGSSTGSGNASAGADNGASGSGNGGSNGSNGGSSNGSTGSSAGGATYGSAPQELCDSNTDEDLDGAIDEADCSPTCESDDTCGADEYCGLEQCWDDDNGGGCMSWCTACGSEVCGDSYDSDCDGDPNNDCTSCADDSGCGDLEQCLGGFCFGCSATCTMPSECPARGDQMSTCEIFGNGCGQCAAVK